MITIYKNLIPRKENFNIFKTEKLIVFAFKIFDIVIFWGDKNQDMDVEKID